MLNLSYPYWEDLRVVIVISIAIGIISFVLISKFTNKFQCSNWIIFIPPLISAVGIVVSIALIVYFSGKDGILQHSFLGLFTYSVCTLIVTVIISLMILTFKK